MNDIVRNTLRPACAALAAVILATLFGCAAPPPRPAAEEPTQLVWPAPPEPARVRYVGSLNSLESPADQRQRSLRDRLLGVEDDAEKTLSKPYGVHSDGRGRVFVTDTGLGGLVVFDTARGTAEFWGVTGAGKLTKPIAVTSDAAGRVYVVDAVDQRIVVFDSEGGYLTALGGSELLEWPVGVTVNDRSGHVYVVDSRKHHVLALDLDNNPVLAFGEQGTEPGQFNYPTNIASGPDGRLYVSDTMNFRVQVFEPDGTVVRTFGELGNGVGQFNRIKGLGVDSDGHIYVVDASFNNFQVFDPDGRLLLWVGEGGRGPGQFYLPAGAHVDRNDRIYVADQFNRRIQMFDYVGGPPAAGLDAPGGMQDDAAADQH